MWTAVKTLSNEQKQCVRDLGLSSILDMSLDVMPSHIGHFVVEHYDPARNCLDLGHIIIQINEEKIHQILGIPNQGVDLSSQEDCESNNQTLALWKQQHKDIAKKLQPICDLIEKSDDADEMFVLNFLTLFVNTMIEKYSSGTLEIKHLTKLINVQDKNNINWCKYVNDTLIKSKEFWKPNNLKTYYAGPVPFLNVSKI